jgi:hypothetical protein
MRSFAGAASRIVPNRLPLRQSEILVWHIFPSFFRDLSGVRKAWHLSGPAREEEGKSRPFLDFISRPGGTGTVSKEGFDSQRIRRPDRLA